MKELRIASNYTQSELAEKLYYSTKYIGDLENARRRITPQNAERIANIFNIDAKYLLDENIKFKTLLDQLHTISTESENENRLMFNAIICLAALDDYKVELQDIYGGDKLTDIFERQKELMTFYRNGKKVFSLSLEDANRFGNAMYEIFMSIIKLHWDKSLVFDIKST